MNETEKEGLKEFLSDPEFEETLFNVARCITMNVCQIQSSQEALNYILNQKDDARVLLHKKLFTKEVLLKYLTKRKINLPQKFTKVQLVELVLRHWNEQEESPPQIVEKTMQNTSQPGGETMEFPINVFAFEFAQWFFDKYNKIAFKCEDFWADIKLQLRIAFGNVKEEQIFEGSQNVLDALVQAKQCFDFFFNPNLTQNGVQGRYDVHGMAIVISCGTLHKQSECVGVFECIFGLLRDPFSENNWKTKMIECIFKGGNVQESPTLFASKTFNEILALPSTD